MNIEKTVAAYRVRTASAADTAVIAYHRVAMFRDMGVLDEAEAPALEAASREYLRSALSAGEYLGWVIDLDGTVVGGGGLIMRRLLPRPGYPSGGEEAYVLNVYTEPAHRRRGVARALMQAVMTWCRERGAARVTLHASDDGRALYERMGFVHTNEMRFESLS